jgi:hypothetical protein
LLGIYTDPDRPDPDRHAIDANPYPENDADVARSRAGSTTLPDRKKISRMRSVLAIHNTAAIFHFL